MPEVLAVTTMGPGREWCAAFAWDAMRALGADGLLAIMDGCEVTGNADGVIISRVPAATGGKIDRIARVRNEARRLFLTDSSWTHLYFHDCDVVPDEPGIVQALLAANADMATGICPLRADELQIPLVYQAACHPRTHIYNPSYVDNTALACGMACCLIARPVLKRVKFRTGAALDGASEDYKFCWDAGCAAAVVQRTVTHVDADGRRYGVRIGAKTMGAVWEDGGFIRNNQGVWRSGAFRTDITADDMATLKSGFWIGERAPITLHVSDQ